ncbi:hypothetical protein EVAR_80093_1 [Eumeta japonica]|uniref:Uncharacterized protein n=1 Tax=Eumeta variegata TaxID=151549 RepID=A0A4C1UDN6_EUMVA|nr:hypothetical protein EVAR_80093_1 [Eumeta japonica]
MGTHNPSGAANPQICVLGSIGRQSGREIDASQAERLGRSCLSVACSALSLARSAQAERDNELCFFNFRGSRCGAKGYVTSLTGKPEKSLKNKQFSGTREGGLLENKSPPAFVVCRRTQISRKMLAFIAPPAPPPNVYSFNRVEVNGKIRQGSGLGGDDRSSWRRPEILSPVLPAYQFFDITKIRCYAARNRAEIFAEHLEKQFIPYPTSD